VLELNVGIKCWKKSKYSNEWFDKEENERKEKLKQRADKRQINRNKQIEQIKNKYSKDEFLEDEYI
jgi:hypothetical protein